ncbi:MAG: exodeoxyribonuclease III [Rickettsiales bacterium]|nr:exodeoxyribonuclease III [Rickettsiales bacterium]
MRIVTWNINSIRLRVKQVTSFIKKYKVDLICLQETKTINKDFPLKAFYKEGFNYCHYRGEKSYNGVAILSKIPFKSMGYREWNKVKESRHVYVTLNNNITLHNFYIPAGGDIPDITQNSKFKYKLDFMQEMIKFFKKSDANKKILVGDLNIAPGVNDVWSHKQLTKVVSHTPIEINYFNQLLKVGKWHDVIRLKSQKDEKLYSWWSYRNKDWKKSNRGRRLDHILISKDLIKYVGAIKIFKEIRDSTKPSDHVPVMLDINK